MNQLNIFQALPVSLPYSEVGLLDENYEEKLNKPEKLSFSLKTPANNANGSPVIRRSLRGSPLQHFPPKSTLAYSRTSDLSKSSLISPPNTDSPIIILHDLFRSQKEWQSFAADLAVLVRRRVLAVDLRNHGTSPAETSLCGLGELLADITALFKELKLNPANTTLMGHGIGGWCAMIFALLHPYKLRNIIVVEANPTDNNYLRYEVLKLEDALVRVQTPARGRSLTESKLKTSDTLKESAVITSLRAYTIENIVVSDVVGKPERWNQKKNEIVASLKSLTKFPTFLKSYCFDKPALFVASAASKTIKTEDESNILTLFPQATFLRYEKVTKNPHVELFDDFLDIVRDFLLNDNL
ncbi:hypothetical protein O3M35_002269 [Rhynocoris fuscipes]|uniref:sn-1-specific diacylglycerol lipase ABHD11 n=1 Tax=Rhynocoris fuscipes TaxID=488301 RepID=A0AAW1CWG6_9HEMI